MRFFVNLIMALASIVLIIAVVFWAFVSGQGSINPESLNFTKLTTVLNANRELVAAFVAMLIGSSVGAVELIGRYRDEPFRALLVGSAVFYVLLNGILSMVAYWGLYIFYKETYFTNELKDLVYAVLIAGFGSLAIMRTAVAKVQIADQEVPIGPAQFIDTLLKAADNGVDRNRARKRLRAVPSAVKDNNIEGEMKLTALRVVALGAMQNLSASERKQTNDEITKLLAGIKQKGSPRHTAAISIGMLLQQRLGNKTFAEACQVVNGLDLSPIKDSSEDSPAKSFIRKHYTKNNGKNAGISENSDSSVPGSTKDPMPEVSEADKKPDAIPKPLSS